MGYEQLDRLTREEVQSIKRRTKARVRAEKHVARAAGARAGAAGQSVIFADGDSWFDFPPGVDIIDHLVNGHDLDITRFSKHGDTMDNMVYGVKSGAPQIEEFLRKAAQARPRVVLFSGGGNDVMGDELLRYLNHSASGLPLLRDGVADYLVHTALRNAIGVFISRVRAVAGNAHFILHGYGRPFPTGMKTHCGPFAVAGPWIRPSLDAMKIPVATGTPLVHGLTDMFNAMLAGLADSLNRDAGTGNEYVTYVDVRGLIQEGDWRDELHLKASAYARVADAFAAAVNAVIGAGPAGLAAAPRAGAREPGVQPYWEEAKRRAKKPGRKKAAKKRSGKRERDR